MGEAGPAHHAPWRTVWIVLVPLLAVAFTTLTPSRALSAAPLIQNFTATVTDTNLITLDWTITDGAASSFVDLGELGRFPQSCPSVQPVGCSTSVRVMLAGVQRYTLSVADSPERTGSATVEAFVSPLAPPTTPQARIVVDMLNVGPRVLSWSHAGPGFVKIVPPGAVWPYSTEFPATGMLAVPASALRPGSRTFQLRYCERAQPGVVAICSPATPVTYAVGPATIAGPYRKFATANHSLTLSWSGSGNKWFLYAPTLGVTAWLTSPGFTVPGAWVSPGVHPVAVISCIATASTSRCSNQSDITAPVAGLVRFTVAPGSTVASNQSVGKLTPALGGTTRTLVAPGTGRLQRLVADGAHVRAGAKVAYVATGIVSRAEVVVGSAASVPAWTVKRWGDAFTAKSYDESVRPSTGDALDIAFDASGDIWQLGEFSTAIAHVHNGVLTSHDSPLALRWNAAQTSRQPVSPFAMNALGANVPTSTSMLGERVVATPSAVWYAHGGGLFYTGAYPNHSRLIRFDLHAADDPSTPGDERLCVIHVPGDNNEVMGLGFDPATNRIWFTETRVNGAASLDWFVDDGQIPCDNDLDYSDAAAVTAVAAKNRCATASQTGCIHEIRLPSSVFAAGQLSVDSKAGYVWIVDWATGTLVRYSMIGGKVLSLPLPKSTEGSSYTNGGTPWQIRVGASAVFVNEYSDNQIVRFDKTIATPATTCTKLVNGANPCMSEIFLPMLDPNVNAHSLALFGGKLWFTELNDTPGNSNPDSSTFGYIDAASWAAGRPTGVYYSNLSTLGLKRPSRMHSFRGIDVTAGGNVALADAAIDEIIALTPR
jgi:hypothetical protein